MWDLLENVRRVFGSRGDRLPASCLRGMYRAEWVRDGEISTAAFVPDPKSINRRKESGFEPPGWDVSVDWEDDPTVVDKTLRADTAKFGAARLTLAHIRYVGQLPGQPKAVHPERRSLRKNPHHGNLVYLDHIGDLLRKSFAGALATGARYVPNAPKK